MIQRITGIYKSLANRNDPQRTAPPVTRQIEHANTPFSTSGQVATLMPGVSMSALARADATCASSNSATHTLTSSSSRTGVTDSFVASYLASGSRTECSTSRREAMEGGILDAFAFHELPDMIDGDHFVARGQHGEPSTKRCHGRWQLCVGLSASADKRRHSIAQRELLPHCVVFGYIQRVFRKVECGSHELLKREAAPRRVNTLFASYQQIDASVLAPSAHSTHVQHLRHHRRDPILNRLRGGSRCRW